MIGQLHAGIACLASWPMIGYLLIGAYSRVSTVSFVVIGCYHHTCPTSQPGDQIVEGLHTLFPRDKHSNWWTFRYCPTGRLQHSTETPKTTDSYVILLFNYNLDIGNIYLHHLFIYKGLRKLFTLYFKQNTSISNFHNSNMNIKYFRANDQLNFVGEIKSEKLARLVH